MPFTLRVGSKLIHDIQNPQPSEMDLEFIDARLRRIVRFSDHPRSLVVAQHRLLVERLVQRVARCDADGIWAKRHDDPEAITGDLVGPIKNLISTETRIFLDLEDGLALAILQAHGWTELQARTIIAPDIQRFVHTYDKMAETFEWQFIMGEPPAGWNMAYTSADRAVFELWVKDMGGVDALLDIGPHRDVRPITLR